MIKKGLGLLLLLIWVQSDSALWAQVYNMCSPSNNQSVNTCTGNFYDSGGPSGNYTNNNNCTYTFCADQPGQCIMVNFNTFQVNDIFLGFAFDYLDVWDGSSVATGTYMFTISGGPFPAPFPVASSTGCLTFVFTSDGSVRDPGWDAAITCQPCPIPSNVSQQDCNGSIPVCEEQYYQPFSFIGNNGSNIVPASSCLAAGELNNSWYVFTAQNSGNLSFVITPNFSNDDYDWAVYDISNNGCSGISSGTSPEISCNFSAEVLTWAGQTGANSGSPYFGFGNNQTDFGDPFNASIPVVAGNTYALVVSNFSASQGGYYLDLSPSTATLFDNTAPILESLVSPNCGSTQITVNFSEPTLCSSLQANDFTLSGPGGPFTITAVNSTSCTGAGVQFTQSAVLSVSSPLLQSGNYEVCLTNAAGGISDLCANTTSSGCINSNLSTSLVANAGVDQTICTSGSTVNLGGSPSATGGAGGYSYVWSPSIGIQSGLNTATPLVSPPSTNTYTLLVTDALGCQSTDEVEVLVQPSTLTTISYSSPFCKNISTPQAVNLQGTTGGTFSSTGGLSINPSTGAITPSASTAGTYTITYSIAASGGCPAFSTTQNVVINALPATPSLIPSPICEGLATTLTAGNGSWYEFFVDGVSQAPPSAANTWLYATPVAGETACVRSYPPPPFTFEGAINEAAWGSALASSAGGPVSGFGPTNNLDAVYLHNSGGYLFGAIAGQTANNSNNRILMFIDCVPGGFNNLGAWSNRSNSPYVSVQNLNGLITFDPGFNPDFVLCMNQASGIAFFDLYDMQNNLNYYLGSNVAADGVLPANLLGYQPNGAQGNYTQGFEFAVPLGYLGNPANMQTFCMLVNDPGLGNTAATFVSNQFLTPANVGESNYGDGFIDFGLAAPNPISYSLSADCHSETCLVVTPALAPMTSFTYTPKVCIDNADIGPTGGSGFTSGGSYSSTAGLSINSSTGLIDVSASTPGTYIITYTIPASGCNPLGSSTFSVTIDPLPSTTPIYHD
jgi:hypothetical protein